MTRIFEQLLAQRGLSEDFLHPRYEDLFDPFLMQGVKEAVERIEQARQNGEKIIIYGDYDADGVTSSTVCRDALEHYGCNNVEIMLPNRFKDGYGLNKPAVAEIEERGAKLVITVDCGSGSGEVIQALSELGIDTIVTDHHEIPKMPKDAVAVINPKRSGEKYGLNMAGVGVAFTLARALNKKKNNGATCDGQEKWLLDMVAIGTVCDSMVLREENRIMVHYGMVVLGKTRRRGVQELARVAGCSLSDVNTHAIGFQLGPRINAAGRMKSADVALELMLTNSRSDAVRLADELNELNRARRQAQDDAVREVNDDFDGDSVIVACGDWHEGVVGIIAGRLSEIYRRPAFALTRLDDGTLKGSGRSFGEFSLANALQACPDGLLLSGGGHAGACGLSMEGERLDDFKKQMNDYYHSLGLQNQERFLRQESDIVLKDLSELDLVLFDEIQQLEPFGVGNEEPIFEFSGRVVSTRVLKEKHLSLMVSDGENEIRLIGFYVPDEWRTVENGDFVKVQFTLTRNEWRGQVSLEGAIISLEEIEQM